MLGIIGAMKIEVDEIALNIENAKRETISGVEYISGTLFGKDVVCAVCGIGKVNAAVCAEAMILKYKPEAIINTGVGGSLRSDLKVLDVVVGTYAVQHDADTSALGDPKGLVSTVNLIQFPLSEEISDKLMKALEKEGIRAVRGAIATGDQFISEKTVKDRIAGDFSASACEMEGGAIAHACYLNNVPCAILRAISDGADDDAHLSYQEFAILAAKQSVKAIFTFAKEF